VFGFTHRQVVVDFMGKALIADLYSLDPSCSADEFGPLLSAVGQLRLLRAGDAVIAREFWNARLMARVGVEEAAFARRMLEILRQGKGWEALFDSLLPRAATLCSPEEMSWLVQRFLRALRAIPAQLWKSAKHYADAMEELDELVKATLAREFLRSHSAARRRIGV
jgi:type III secretion system protein